MKHAAKQNVDGVFGARLGLGLRELDDLEESPDVTAAVLRGLADHRPASERSQVRWLAVAAALLAIGVTATLLVQRGRDKGATDPAAAGAPQDPAGGAAPDPAGPWRLVYELPLDELQRAVRGKPDGALEQLLARSAQSLQRRIGDRAQVTRGDAATFTVRFENAAPGDVAAVRSLLENPGQLEMRIVADADYAAPGMRFDIAKERQRLEEWLDGGGRERLQRDPRAIADYRGAGEGLGWFVHRVRPSPDRPDAWNARYADIPLLGTSVVAAHAEGDWNDGKLPERLLASPIEQRFLLELVLVNMHEVHFRETDVDPTSIARTADQRGEPAVAYGLLGGKQGEYADFSERNLHKCCAVIWNGEVLTAPRFESRIPGVGRISGLTEAEAGTIAGVLATTLPASPRLLRSEPDAPR